jgi:predicted RNA-binding Zn-ribbon protein involved in translation (DUF1610 family)
MKHKRSPWVNSRARVKKIEEQLLERKRKILASETQRYGRAIGKKKKRNRHIKDFSAFSCPKCGNNLREDLVRLRQDFYECRKCAHTFIKENVIDEFDFDGLDTLDMP